MSEFLLLATGLGVLLFAAVGLAGWIGALSRPPPAVGWAQRKVEQGAPVNKPTPVDEPSKFASRARMKRLAKPTLLLIPADTPSFSKIGGLPELPSGVSWPRDDDGAPAFVAQIDLAELSGVEGFDWLPATGRIYLFFEEYRNGAPDSGTVIYCLEPPGPEIAAPSDLQPRRRFAERRIAFMRFLSFPSADWLASDWPNGIEWQTWALARDAEFGHEIEHRIGGYPSEIQSAQMAVECESLRRGRVWTYREPVPADLQRASREWRLLLQIDSDPALGMNWWDAGRLYVFVRARDAKRGDFSKTVTITQTH